MTANATRDPGASARRSIPTATYRLQLHAGFGFDDVAALCDYLSALGISHVYLSPYLQAAAGSTHGYDVVDHGRVNAELGGEAAHARMLGALRERGLGQVVDVVPNHMAISTSDNRWWWDVQENGPSSRYAAHFDVDWRGQDERNRDKVLIPILGDHYGRVLEGGHLRVERDGHHFRLWAYDEHVLPLAPISLQPLLRRAAEACGCRDLSFLADALGELPSPTATDAASLLRRQRDKDVLYAFMSRLLSQAPAVANAVDAAIAALNQDVDALDALLDAQNYRIAYWKLARHDLDYRRFFDIHSLAGLRIERPEVMEDVHRLVLSWVEAGHVDGLRIDHPDGLRDPARYFAALRARAADAWIVAEKILMPDERLPDDWDVDGTTGYDFLFIVGQLLLDSAGEAPLRALYGSFIGRAPEPFDALVQTKKASVLDELLGADLNRLTGHLLDVCEHRRRFRDFGREELRAAVRAFLIAMPVYRTYVNDAGASSVDRARIEAAAQGVRDSGERIDGELLGMIERILVGELDDPAAAEFRARFQQLSGPAMAKGAEDTAFYCDHMLVSRNEVGGEPARFGLSLADFHAHCEHIAAQHPWTMLTTSTHDTKRSEDVRVRIALLSEIPDRFRDAVLDWSQRAAPLCPERLDRETEYLIYQTLVGAFPIGVERLSGYLIKAVREAKVHTSWHEPDGAYEAAVVDFATAVLEDEALAAEVAAFVESLATAARMTSLVQLVLKLTAPGVPDIYQGNEGFRFDLTDPDNRRPIDFAGLRAKLARVQQIGARGPSPAALLSDPDPDLAKLHVTRTLLHLRREHPQAFLTRGGYTALWASGERAAHVVAFARADAQVVSVVPRLLLRHGLEFGDTHIALPPGAYHNVLTDQSMQGGEVTINQLLTGFPAAVLHRRD